MIVYLNCRFKVLIYLSILHLLHMYLLKPLPDKSFADSRYAHLISSYYLTSTTIVISATYKIKKHRNSSTLYTIPRNH